MGWNSICRYLGGVSAKSWRHIPFRPSIQFRFSIKGEAEMLRLEEQTRCPRVRDVRKEYLMVLMRGIAPTRMSSSSSETYSNVPSSRAKIQHTAMFGASLRLIGSRYGYGTCLYLYTNMGWVYELSLKLLEKYL